MQEIASGLPGVSTVQNDLTTYLNYSINPIHHWTPSSAFDATTSIGFVRERRSDNAPDIVAQNLLSGVNSPTAGTVTSVFYNRDAAYDQSLYAQEQVLTLDQRLALRAGVTAERTTNDGDIDKFYYYPHFSASYRVPQFVSFLDEFKLRAAYGQSGTEPNYGVKYTPDSSALVGGLLTVYPAELHGDQSIRPEPEAEIETGLRRHVVQVAGAVQLYGVPEADFRPAAAGGRRAGLGYNERVDQRRRVHEPGDRARADGDARPVPERLQRGTRPSRSTATTAS